MDTSRQTFLATCPVGCETLLSNELTKLGLTELRQERNGVRFTAAIEDAQKVCLWSRVASRVFWPLASFQAQSSQELYDNASNIAWEEHISSLNTFAIQGIGTNQALRHSGFVALKVKDALVDRMRKKIGRRPDVAKEDPDVRISAHVQDERVEIALDVSGISLHRRGWRGVNAGIAPIKENLAAAILLFAGYEAKLPLLDPMCGSGTFLIEAIEMGLELAPGRRLNFGFERWATFSKPERKRFDDLRRAGGVIRRKEIPPVWGGDSDLGMVRQALINLENAGLRNYARVEKQDARTAQFPNRRGLLVTNPPYGERLEEDNEKLMALYRDLGQQWKELGDGRLAIFCAHPDFRKTFGLKTSDIVELHNGPIRTKLFLYDIGAAFSVKPNTP